MQQLKSLPFFAAITEEETTNIAVYVEFKTISSGETFIEPWSITDGFWFLVDGRWRVTRKVAGKPQEMFESDRPGTWTGGITVIDKIAPVMAQALTDCELIWIAKTGVEELVASNPTVATRLLEAVNWGSDYIGELAKNSHPQELNS